MRGLGLRKFERRRKQLGIWLWKNFGRGRAKPWKNLTERKKRLGS